MVAIDAAYHTNGLHSTIEQGKSVAMKILKMSQLAPCMPLLLRNLLPTWRGLENATRQSQFLL